MHENKHLSLFSKLCYSCTSYVFLSWILSWIMNLIHEDFVACTIYCCQLTYEFVISLIIFHSVNILLLHYLFLYMFIYCEWKNRVANPITYGIIGGVPDECLLSAIFSSCLYWYKELYSSLNWLYRFVVGKLTPT